MKENYFKKHVTYYGSFAIIQILGLILIILAKGDRQTQMFSVLALSVFYVVFAILHHAHDHDLTPKIVIEYALFGSLGLTFAMFALYFNN
jgi:hypothetical protein